MQNWAAWGLRGGVSSSPVSWSFCAAWCQCIGSSSDLTRRDIRFGARSSLFRNRRQVRCRFSLALPPPLGLVQIGTLATVECAQHALVLAGLLDAARLPLAARITGTIGAGGPPQGGGVVIVVLLVVVVIGAGVRAGFRHVVHDGGTPRRGAARARARAQAQARGARSN